MLSIDTFARCSMCMPSADGIKWDSRAIALTAVREMAVPIDLCPQLGERARSIRPENGTTCFR